jgi:ABC-2 type transport system permease protein
MSGQYNQWTAMWAICRATLRAIFKSPQAIFFSLFFPIVLIMVFGALTGGGGKAYDVAFDAKSDTTSNVYFAIRSIAAFDIHRGSEADLLDQLKKGRITALIEVRQLPASTTGVQYDIHLKTTSASQKDLPAVQALLKSYIDELTANTVSYKVATVSVEEIKGRPYHMIDFYLPGMLGFSLIGSAVLAWHSFSLPCGKPWC